MFTGKEPKVICTIRPISEIITSYITLIEKNHGKNNFVDADLIKENKKINVSNRAEKLWKSYISDPYQSVQHGLAKNKSNMFFVEYDEFYMHRLKGYSSFTFNKGKAKKFMYFTFL